MREKERTTEGRREGKTSLQTDNLNKKNTKTQKHKNTKTKTNQKLRVEKKIKYNRD